LNEELGCNYNDEVSEILSGEIKLFGEENLDCRDLRECAEDYVDTRSCESDVDFYMVEEEVCGRTTIVAYNIITDLPIFQVDLENWDEDRLDVSFVQSDVIYCSHCYNGLQDGGEEDVDCGGDCKECLPSDKRISFGDLIKWPLWLIILLMLAILAKWLDEEWKKENERGVKQFRVKQKVIKLMMLG
jgi:hypothetical protein